MAERKRSHDGSRDTEKVLGKQGSVSQGGREGGALAREIGSKDELKRSHDRPGGHTDVTKSVERGNKA